MTHREAEKGKKPAGHQYSLKGTEVTKIKTEEGGQWEQL